MAVFKKGRERRRYPRFHKYLSVCVKGKEWPVAAKTPGREDKTLEGRDISKGGLCFFSDRPYEVDAFLSLIIRVSSPEEKPQQLSDLTGISSIPIRARVRVVWCQYERDQNHYSVGVAFEEIQAPDYKILERHLGE